MGVPRFFRWVTSRYPIILTDEITSKTNNPQFDNLYLDMNGIIHASSRHEDTTIASLSFNEVMVNICRYLDHLIVDIVRPLRVLFIAIDGVAPRAKLNQQRSRRFRASYDRLSAITRKATENTFDSNSITPGTQFMSDISKYLKIFIEKRMQENEIWGRLHIYFSGAEVPGEGEHKIVSFIRELKENPSYLPNQRHIMNGQDADMIMLGLASHEPFFFILREMVSFDSKKTTNVKFQYLRLNLLRETLIMELSEDIIDNTTYDNERFIDDFIFLTFVIGNLSFNNLRKQTHNLSIIVFYSYLLTYLLK